MHSGVIQQFKMLLWLTFNGACHCNAGWPVLFDVQRLEADVPFVLARWARSLIWQQRRALMARLSLFCCVSVNAAGVHVKSVGAPSNYCCAQHFHTGAEEYVITFISFHLILSCSSSSHDFSANKLQWTLWILFFFADLCWESTLLSF